MAYGRYIMTYPTTVHGVKININKPTNITGGSDLVWFMFFLWNPWIGGLGMGKELLEFSIGAQCLLVKHASATCVSCSFDEVIINSRDIWKWQRTQLVAGLLGAATWPTWFLFGNWNWVYPSDCLLPPSEILSHSLLLRFGNHLLSQ